MKSLAVLLLSLAMGPCLAAETYKWIDEKGVVNYGEKPPANRKSTSIDTNPSGIVESGGQGVQKTAPDSRRPDEELKPQVTESPAPLVPATPSVRGMDFDVYVRLQRGMTEAELLIRAGRPDYQSLDNVIDLTRTYYYLPTIANPFITTVKVRDGVIVYIDRVRKF